ncbi:restriction endonuclease [Streptomyces sp. FL07-04A]|uniref:nSTAND1 domain-containing NTPase n=1 Tax=Streptomyces sp. FL07-04A TaxID=3028658 RepID=UPI0029A1750F|nr:restriction endonuclease [Streptomyces sp. FL07-04A]MDX3575507.1 restriction endonuclease [Streptomyces sp. FL07-04A]
MDRVTVETHQVIVLADGETQAAISNKKGHLFEVFIVNLLHEYGYAEPEKAKRNVTADGIELDIVTRSKLTNDPVIVECKAYTSNVKAQACTSFLGKLQLAKYDDPNTKGYLFVLPRLVAEGEEVAKKATENDTNFHYLDTTKTVELLRERRVIRAVPGEIHAQLLSDPAVLVSEFGVFSCVKSLDPQTHRSEKVYVWGKESGHEVPSPLLELLAADSYAAGLSVAIVGRGSAITPSLKELEESSPPVIVSVRGSSSDFEYQFPASPKFFVGRKGVLVEIGDVLATQRGALVLNAQSGWGKSSLALQTKQMVDSLGGYAIVVDSRTASNPRFVSEVLREAGVQAAATGLIELPEDSSWASLGSAIATFERSKWNNDSPILIFFDQFENVFQDESTTREFRNLALRVGDSSARMLVGFAWKTDLVGWTESHPYRLRDEIRASSVCVNVGPMGAREIETLLRRLEKRIGDKLAADLRQRLREYSQGLPWLFKKLAGHVIKELEQHGKSQEVLVSEGLNVQSLFASDLSGLSPLENEAVRHVARFAPVTATEVTEKYDGAVVQSLLDSRLVVAVGDKLDTYWDIFRDFLNTGRVPIEDSYTVRQNPGAVARLLLAVINSGGDISVSDLCEQLNASAGIVYNLSRELRLFGLTAYEPNRVRLLDDVMAADDREQEIRRRVGQALRRHRAYSLFTKLAERYGDRVAVTIYARELPEAFPAVEAQANTWNVYARAFSLWFEYAGLALIDGNYIGIPPEDYAGKGSLLDQGKEYKGRSGFSLHYTPGPCLVLLQSLAANPRSSIDLGKSEKRFANALMFLGLVQKGEGGVFRCTEGAIVDGEASQEFLLQRLRAVPGADEALAKIASDPRIENIHIGEAIRSNVGANWEESTTDSVGGDFRSWAKAAGVEVKTARRRMRGSEAVSDNTEEGVEQQLEIEVSGED